MGLRARIHDAFRRGLTDAELEELVRSDRRAVRYLLGMSYHSDSTTRALAAKGIAMASRHHPALVENVVRRLVWAMNDESGTNALTAPELLQAIAEERPELLLPVVPDLTRLAADPGLREGLSATLRTIVLRCPGRVGESLTRSLNECRGMRHEETL